VVGTDIFATVMELAGGPGQTPDRVEGASLLAHVKSAGKAPVDRKDPFLVFKYTKERPPHDATIIQGDYKLIKDIDTDTIFLFNLKDDIGERRNLASQQPQRAQRMYADMTAYFARFGWDESKISNKQVPRPKRNPATPGKKQAERQAAPPASPNRKPLRPAADKPNVVFIFIDDMGYGDIGPFGNTVNKTPHLDRMAKEGQILRQYYVSNTACTPSRSALLTGTYAHRIGMDGTVVFPGEKRGLNPSEITIAELMKTRGYATGCFGKWHLGDQPQFMPLNQGFDEYFGIPYSNDMWPGNLKGHRHTKEPYTPLPIVHQNEAVAYVSDGTDQSLLCEVVTDEAVKFIKKHQNEPFFCYIPHAYVHLPRYARPDIFKTADGSTARSNVEEVDTSVGRVLDTLRQLGLEKNTLVIFTSDNGGSRGMTMGPLRGAKGGPKYEGHILEPTLSWWPGTIPVGSETDQIVATIDMLPSLARLIGAEVPTDRIIDGKDALDVLLGKPGATSPHPILYYEIDGIRRGKWKLVRGRQGFELYDLDADVGETNDLAGDQPELAAELEALLAKHAKEIEENQRSPGMLEEARPIISEPGNLPKLRDFMGMPNVEALNEAIEVRAPNRATNRPPSTAALRKTPAKRKDVIPADVTLTPDDILVADFEGDGYGGWVATGTAFGDKPVVANVTTKNKVFGHRGRGMVNTFLGGDKPTGTLTSPSFNIERRYIHLLVGGGNNPGKTCINLVIGGKVVHTATGSSNKDTRGRETLDWTSWDVSQHLGKRVHLQIIDTPTKRWGHINIDHIFQSDRTITGVKRD
jgi:arylsulfatase A-like enzyme